MAEAAAKIDTDQPSLLAPIVDKTDKKTSKGKRGGARPNTGGRRPGSGWKPGSPNKITADVKNAIVEAFDKAGGVAYLVEVAKTNPQVFCSLLGKVLPLQVTGQGGGPIQITWSDDNTIDITPNDKA